MTIHKNKRFVWLGTPIILAIFLGLFLAVTFTVRAAPVTQDFDGLSENSYGNYTYQGWEINNGLCNVTNARSGNAVRLRNAAGSNLQYVGADGNGKDGGLGTISFWYRSWDASPTAEYQVQYKQGAGSWTNIGSLISTSSIIYAEFSESVNIGGDDILVQVIRINGERLHIDDVLLTDYTAGVSISKDVSPSSIGYQENVTYTVVLENPTLISDTNVLFTDTLPAEVDFASWVDQPAGATVTADEVTWSGTVTASEAITFTFVASHVGAYGEVVTNTAVFSGTIITGTAEATFTVASDTPDMTISKTGPDTAMAGDTIVYTVVVGNEGGGMATGWAITDTLPISVTYVSSNYTTPPTTSTVGSRETLVWSDAGNWVGGFTETFKITATVSASITNGTIITNNIEISTDTIGDPLNNNSDQVETAVYAFVPIATARAGSNGETFAVEGKVIYIPGMYNYGGWGLQDASGGIAVYYTPPATVSLGDMVRLISVRGTNNGAAQLGSPLAFENLGSGSEVVPTAYTTSELDDGSSEGWLIVLTGEISGLSCPNDNSFSIDDGSGAAAVYIDSDTGVDVCAMGVENGDTVSAVGFSTQYNGSFQLMPRQPSDITLTKPSISKTAPAFVEPGELFTYTLTIGNYLSYELTNLVIEDTLPISSTFAHASDSGGLDMGVVTWTVPSLANGASITRTFAVTATSVDGTDIVNQIYTVSASEYTTVTAGSPITTTIIETGCGGTYTPVYDIQGNGASSPVVGDVVFTEGVVTAVFQEAGQVDGFYIQDSTGDGITGTSDGIYIDSSIVVAVGDAVRVNGTVNESYGFTEINNIVSVLTCGSGTIPPTAVSLPIATLDTWEQYEGMLLDFSQGLYVTEHYVLGRYGEVSLSVNDRLYNPTNITTPGAAAIAQQNLNDRSRIQLDDSYTTSNRDPIVYPGTGLSYTNTLRGGDYVATLTGVLDYAYGSYKIQPTAAVDFTVANTRTVTTEDVNGRLTVASFNVLNYFTTLDDSGDICGPSGNMGCRGADTANEFVRQRVKIINAIVAMDADIIGLMEIENNGYGASSAIQDLVDGLNDATITGTYAFVDPGVSAIGTDAIAVGMLYKPANVSPAGMPQILDSAVISTFNDLKNRPVLAQAFTENVSGEIVTIAVNHLKSKGSDCNDLGDPDMDDGQGNCNVTRTTAAEALVDWLATDPTGSGSDYSLIIGDLNSYAMENPITVIKEAGYDNLLFDFGGLYAYSYVYSGQFGYLDHALSSTALTPFVTGATTWHINADEPISLDYNENYKSANQHITLYGEGPYRASDHDPVIIGLTFPITVYLPIIMK